MNLTEAAKKAMINASSNRQGTVVYAEQEILNELWNARLIGPINGLTRKGTIVRERLVNAALEDAFS